MDWNEAVRCLDRALAGDLPGEDAHALMAPFPREGWVPGRVPEEAREAATLVLLLPADAGARFVLTARPGHLPRHGGQVSLPGGAVDPGEGVEEAALREAAEEIGADPGAIRILGRLSPLHIPVSGFVMHPVVGVASRRPNLRARAGEVAGILEPTLAELLDPARLGREIRRLGTSEIRIPYYRLAGRRVWGATAMVLAEVAWLLDPPRRD